MIEGSQRSNEEAARGAELAAAMTVRPDGDGYLGTCPDWFDGHLFGGVLIGQAVHAASLTGSAGRRLHSLHAYFLRPGDAAQPIAYGVETIRDGRTFGLRRVTAVQSGKEILAVDCSLTTDGEGYEYQMPRVDVPELGGTPIPAPGPWEAIQLGPTAPAADGTRRSTSRAWLRAAGPLGDDPHTHASVLGLFSDFTFTGGRPLHLDGDVRGLTSLDHALWIHRPVRADEWLLYDVHSLINTGGRGLLRGVFHTADGVLVASVAQEMLIRPYQPD